MNWKDSLIYRFNALVWVLYAVLLSQIKFRLGLSAFWLAEAGGFIEIWNVLVGVFAGRLLPLSFVPLWLRVVGDALPFSSLYAFPLRLRLKQAEQYGKLRRLRAPGFLARRTVVRRAIFVAARPSRLPSFRS